MRWVVFIIYFIGTHSSKDAPVKEQERSFFIHTMNSYLFSVPLMPYNIIPSLTNYRSCTNFYLREPFNFRSERSRTRQQMTSRPRYVSPLLPGPLEAYYTLLPPRLGATYWENCARTAVILNSFVLILQFFGSVKTSIN